MLDVTDLRICYGQMEAVRGISFTVREGELVTLIGANGAGKSSTLRAVMGLTPVASGHILFRGEEITGIPSWERAKKGIAIVPEGRRIFPDLTVEENLMVGAYCRESGPQIRRSLETVFDFFPRLKERRRQVGKTLSGGEQQMLSLGRALMNDPGLLLVDEVSLGLMPMAVERAFDAITDLHRRGVTILLVEQNARKALAVADRGYVLETGLIVNHGPARELKQDSSIVRAYLGG